MEKLINGFITNLGKYNEGCLIGEWISFPINEDNLLEVLERIGINEKYEEYFFTDWENNIEGLSWETFGEYANIKKVNELAEQLEELDKTDLEKVSAIMEVDGNDLINAIETMDDYNYYPDASLIDVAYELIEECYELPEIAQRYFDYKAFARDLSFDGYTETKNGVLQLC